MTTLTLSASGHSSISRGKRVHGGRYAIRVLVRVFLVATIMVAACGVAMVFLMTKIARATIHFATYSGT